MTKWINKRILYNGKDHQGYYMFSLFANDGTVRQYKAGMCNQREAFSMARRHLREMNKGDIKSA